MSVAVDKFIEGDLKLRYDEIEYHPELMISRICVTLDEEDALMLRLNFNEKIKLYPVEE